MAVHPGGAGITTDAIRAAHELIPPEFRDTPQLVSPVLSERAGAPIVAKIETLNPIRSFKGRGTSLAVHGLVKSGALGPEARWRGIVTVSTGNFGQGVAYAARANGVRAVVVVPAGGNPGKLAAIRRLGGRVVVVSDGVDPEAEADAIAEREGLIHLADGHDDRIAIGAGTMALEVTDAIAAEDLPAIAAAYVPIGDGSLIAGVAAWLRFASPAARIIGVGTDAAPAMARSWRSGRAEVVPPAPSRADGLASRSGNADLLPFLREMVDDLVLVPERALLQAQHELFEGLGVAAEASGAASWLAAREPTETRPGARLVVVTGSNHWPDDFARMGS